MVSAESSLDHRTITNHPSVLVPSVHSTAEEGQRESKENEKEAELLHCRVQKLQKELEDAEELMQLINDDCKKMLAKKEVSLLIWV